MTQWPWKHRSGDAFKFGVIKSYSHKEPPQFCPVFRMSGWELQKSSAI